MPEINKDLPITTKPFFEIPENSTIIIKTYKVNVEPQTPLYKVAVASAKVLSFLSLVVWFFLLIALLIISISVLNNLHSVQVIRDQVTPSTHQTYSESNQ